MNDGEETKRLWAPWRMEYILGEKGNGCIFCDYPKGDDDRKNLILFRGERVFVIMNRYPYNNGHLMITPYAHESALEKLPEEAATEICLEVRRSVSLLKEAFKADGFNVGMNLGKAAGAGIDDHLHMHIVPRWNGDTNFMFVMADVRVMPELLDETYMKLKPLYESKPFRR